MQFLVHNWGTRVKIIITTIINLKHHHIYRRNLILCYIESEFLVEICCCSVTKSCLTLFDATDRSTPGSSILHCLLEFAKIRVHWTGDAIPPSHPLSSPCLPAFNLPQHQDLSQWVSSLHQVAEILELQLPHQSFWWVSGLVSFRMAGLISLLSKGLSRVFSSTTIQKH